MNNVHKRILTLATLVLSIFSGSFVSAQSLDVESLRRRQDTQQRAREMARELVSGILDVQLQQLEENGLNELPIFRDVQQMRINLDGLVEAEMAVVVQLLVKAQQQVGAERDGTFVQARQRIREVVVRLTVERQNLLRRLKTAELAAQVKRIIERESVVYNVTDALPSLPNSQKTAKQLSIEQDQRDVKVLFLRLVETLADVRGWGGEVGRGAADGLSVLKAAQVGENLDQSLERLAGLDYIRAKQHEQNVLKGLRLLLDRVEETQGLIGADREAALELVRELVKEQEKVREQTRQADLNTDQAQKLVDREQSLQKDLAKLPEALQQAPSTQALAEQAKSAAAEATDKLFNAQRTDALAAQEKVLGNLLEIERRLADDVQRERVDRSAAELREEVQSLEKTREALAKTDEQLKKTEQAPMAEKPKQAQPLEENAKQLAERATDEKQPSVVRARTQEAEQTVAKAAEQTKQPETPEKAAEATKRADDAVERAMAETEAALADAKRRQLAVEAGELARAAEVLERAVAAERDIGDQLKKPDGQRPGKEAVEQMAADQKTINDVVEKVGEALKEIAPQAAKQIESAQAKGEETSDKLKNAAESNVAPQPAAEAAKAAQKTADDLAKAAEQVRKQLGQVAEKLIDESDKQLTKVQPVREKVEEMLRDRPKSTSEQLAQLREASKQVDEALVQQQRAMGKQEAADAMQAATQIADARAKQDEADRAAMEHAQGRASTPLEAALKQEQAADAMRDATKQSARGAKNETPEHAAMAEALNKAQQQAADAAKRTLDGDDAGAKQARQAARQNLEEAAKMAKAAVAEATKKPVGEPDATAQGRVTNAAAKAAEMTGDASPEAGESLAQAEQKSAAAEKQAKAGEKTDAQQKQGETQKSLEDAKQQLAKAEQQLVNELAAQTQRQGAQAKQLAEQAKGVDPAAQASLNAAGEAAKGMNQPMPQEPKNATPAQVPPQTDAQKQLAAAESKVREAINEQLKAAGKMEEAATKKLVEQVAAALKEQSEATQAGELAQNTPGERAKAQDKQQKASEQVNRAAEQAAQRPQAATAKKQPAGDELASRLAEAAKQGQDAHEKMQAGQFAEAGKSQEKAQKALEKAAELAGREAAKAMESEKSKPDLAAQQRANAAAKQAADLAKNAAPDANPKLEQAADAGMKAEKQLAANQADDAQKNQTSAAEALDQALADIQKAQEKANQQAAQVAQQTPMPTPPASATPSTSPVNMPSAEMAQAAQQQTEQAVQRAAASLAEREARVLRDQALAQALKQAAQSQQQSSQQIAEARGAMSGQTNSGESPTPPAGDTQKLAEAMQAFSDAQQVAGQAAEEISGQREIANDPLREGLQLADNLGNNMPAEPGDMPNANTQAAGDAKPQSPGAAGAMPKAGAPQRMGTQFTPNSPEATAQMMAGPQAMAQLAQFQAGKPTSAARSQQQSGQQNASQASAQSAAASSQAATTTGNAQPNSGPALAGKPPGKGNGDTPPGVRTFREEPWVAKLPPELRGAIRAQSQRRAPAAYEERLKRYFENIE